MKPFTYQYKQQKQSGFTLAELLVVIAIIGILTAISIPVFTSQLEKSREATDMANVRSAYAEVMVAANSGENETRVVPLKQKQDGWQTPQKSHKIMIGGITEDNKENWIGNPIANGSCEVYYDPTVGPVLLWSRAFTNLHSAFDNGGLLEYAQGKWGSGANLEIDSGCKSEMVDKVKAEINNDGNPYNLMKYGTWAYMGSLKEKEDPERYLFWTSVNLNPEDGSFKTGTDVPMIISTADGKFYISHSRTSKREGQTYNIIIPKTYTISTYKNYIPKDTEPFTSLNDAYDAYVNFVKTTYPNYTNTLPFQ